MIVLLVGILLRAIAFLTRYRGPIPWNPNEMEDYRVYTANLILHHSMSYHWPHLSTYRLPLYPALLIPFMRNLDLFLLWQTILGTAILIRLWRFIFSYSSSKIATASVVLLAFDLPSIINAASHLRGDTIFTLFVLLAFIQTWEMILDRSKTGFVAALWWGLSAITRTHGVYLPLGLAWLWRKEKETLTIWLAVSMLLPGLWVARNVVSCDQWRLSDSSDYYTVCLASLVEGMRDGKDPSGFPEDAYLPVPREQVVKARKTILAHPIILARYIASASFKYFMATSSEYLLDWLDIPRTSKWNNKGSVSGEGTFLLFRDHPWIIMPTLILTAMQFLFYCLFIVGMIRLAYSEQWQHLFLTLWTAFVLWFPAILVGGTPNYRVPLIPIICIGAAIAIKKSPLISDLE